MKRLHVFLIRAFIPPFIAAFFVTWFIFIMQFMWLWIDEFIGKGLDVLTIFKFIGLLSTTLVPVALPLGILFSAIMTYGKLGETSELVAVKSSGHSVFKFSYPLFGFIALLTVLSFLFNNYTIPVAQLKATRLLYDIQNKKPVVVIKPGKFYKDIPNTAIYISSKESDNQTVHDIKIYDHSEGKGNSKFTVAEKGKMYVSDDKRYLIFELENGWRYEFRENLQKKDTEQVRLGFSYWKKVFDLSDFKMPQTDESYFKNLRAVMSAGQIKKQIDTGYQKLDRMYESMKREVLAANLFLVRNDTSKVHEKLPVITKKTEAFIHHIPDSLMLPTLRTAEQKLRGAKSLFEVNRQNEKLQIQNLIDFRIEYNKRFNLPLACILLFIIGASLGSIIRKGGLGMPFIVAVTFFVIYYFTNAMGENMAKQEVISVTLGLWAPSGFLAIIGIFLMYKANNDSPLMNKEWYFRMGRKISRFLKLKTPQT